MKNLFLIFTVCFLAAPLRAASSDKDKEKVVYENTKIDFEVKSVDGQFMSPEGMAIKSDKNLDFDSMLAPKANFNKELGRDVGAVR